MDLAYDHITEQAFTTGDRATTPTPSTSDTTQSGGGEPATPKATLQTEFQETFKAFSNSAWGARLGGIWGNVRKQGESVYEEARKEAAEMATEVEALRTKVVGLGFGQSEASTASGTSDSSSVVTAEANVDNTGDKRPEGEQSIEEKNKVDQETETFLERFKHEAAKRLKEVQRAEDAADEALLRFGTNIRNFLRDAVSVTAPEEGGEGRRQPGEVLFESKDQSGRRVIHTSRFDAQLHVIHTTLHSFTQDPSTSGGQWEEFKSGFDSASADTTSRIAADLDKYPELRRSMEKLVPEQVDYKDFWARYYFLRHVVEVQEEKRRELLKASANDTEEVGWDEDSDDDQVEKQDGTQQKAPKVLVAQNTNDSSTTLHQTPTAQDPGSLKPDSSGRRSHDEKSVADSDASYDLVSGATSRAPGSPKDDVVGGAKGATGVGADKIDESDEEDWE
ncbi:uncharacterized protein PV06_06990 [Exophiala oligosperma]|uniref:BSD domain-containing protein n=1 Tax=Exophiala oligosperma TaxID=215243 RepID=A0A0D2E0V0_9EURO|nr:uncharacterized protein PV06_06990 [Exophiala oligosperma]KIW41429.1 hypothetical protein PV06_06990 [Exophiala oligosperma]